MAKRSTPAAEAAPWTPAQKLAAGALVVAGLVVLALPPDLPVVLCGTCHAVRRAVPLIYGLPGYEAMEAARRGEVVLGGCVVPGVEPPRACRTCRTPIMGLASLWAGPAKTP